MRITDQTRWMFDKLPEDVQAVLNLVYPEDTVSFESRFEKEEPSTYYIDLWCDEKNAYIFVQDYQPMDQAIRRFISWVHAGMPDGYNNVHRQWEKEE